MSNELIALLDGKAVGSVNRDARGRLRFIYKDDWRNAPDAYPLSLSIPLGAKEHGRSVVEAYLWGLLPITNACLVDGQPNSTCRPVTYSLSSPTSAKTARVLSSS